MATHSGAGLENPMDREPGALQPVESQRIRHRHSLPSSPVPLPGGSGCRGWGDTAWAAVTVRDGEGSMAGPVCGEGAPTGSGPVAGTHASRGWMLKHREPARAQGPTWGAGCPAFLYPAWGALAFLVFRLPGWSSPGDQRLSSTPLASCNCYILP